MSANSGLHLIYSSGVVRLLNYRCGHTHAGLCGEECNDGASIVFPRRGIFRKRSAQGDVIADPTSVVFFNDGESYRIEHPVAGGDECMVFHLHQDVLGDMLARVGFHPKGSCRLADFPIGQIPAQGRDFFMQSQIRRWGERVAPAERLQMDETILQLCGRVIASAARGKGIRPARRQRADTARAHRDWVFRARSVLIGRFRDPIALSEVARAAHCSPYHLCRVFHAETGVTMHRYLTRLRLRAALEKLAEPRVDLTGLALDVGFSSHSHFTRSFQREFGLAPSQARGARPSALREMSKNVQV